jgi:hypothetical protein
MLRTLCRRIQRRRRDETDRLMEAVAGRRGETTVCGIDVTVRTCALRQREVVLLRPNSIKPFEIVKTLHVGFRVSGLGR